MNSFVFVLALMASGTSTEVANFATLTACEQESARINQTLRSTSQVAVCLPKNNVSNQDISRHMSDMMTMMKNMQNEMGKM